MQAMQGEHVTGLRPDLLAQLLPAVASIVMGGMAQRFHNQGLGGVLGQLAGAAQQGNLGATLGQQGGAAQANNEGGGLMGIVTTILGGLFSGGGNAANTTTTASPQTGLDTLTKMFQTGPSNANFSQAGCRCHRSNSWRQTALNRAKGRLAQLKSASSSACGHRALETDCKDRKSGSSFSGLDFRPRVFWAKATPCGAGLSSGDRVRSGS